MFLKIELLSDLCTYSGEIYNSLVDIDVVHDRYGLPYIPAKRLKGCIREAYLELVEFGVYDKETYEKLFGVEGNGAAAFSLSNAYLASYEDLCRDLESVSGDPITHPQNVLNLYSYIRTQTSLDHETGSAEEGSLRSLRVVKKGTVFYAEVNFLEDLLDGEKDAFCKAAGMVTHMGIRRSRGLGLVHITAKEGERTAHSTIPSDMQLFEYNKIPYRIVLNSPLWTKSVEGNQTKCMHFIEGSRILGMIADAMGSEVYRDMMNSQTPGHEVIASNAYIECNQERCLPVSASIQKIKDQTFDSDGSMEAYDMLVASMEGKQLTPAGEEYATSDYVVKSVATSIGYHHKRPQDKSIGRATGEDGSEFYQLESLNEGQAFRGYILADKEQAERILSALKQKKVFRLGNGRNTEYGNIDFQMEPAVSLAQTGEVHIVHDFMIQLDSAVILYNDFGMPTADVKDLVTCLARMAGCNDLTITSCFLKYETIGGYNVTWHRQKPVFSTLGQGTVCLLHSDGGVNISLLENRYLGERVSEGYGEVRYMDVPQDKVMLKREEEKKPETRKEQTEILQLLRENEARKRLREKARAEALRNNQSFQDADSNAIIRRLLMINKEQDSLEEMEEQVKQWSSDKKRERAQNVVKGIQKILDEQKCENGVLIDEKEAYQIVSREYLMQLKYQHREAVKGEKVTDHE